MKIRVVISDRSFNVVSILDNRYLDLTWAYSRIGGCGEFSLNLPIKLFDEQAISGDYNVKIYHRNVTTKGYDLWYQGLIENKIPSVDGIKEEIQISGHGYQVQLSRMYIDNVTFNTTEVSVIVKSLLDTYITPYTDITYSALNIQATTFTPDTINFNTDVLSAMQQLADITGTREWGVDANRSFFFKQRSSTVGFYYSMGNNITSYNENQDFSAIINRVIVQGAQTGGTYFKASFDSVSSQAKYGIRTSVQQNSSVVTSSVAQQLASAVFAEFNDVVRKSTFQLVGIEAQLEATNPIPLLNIAVKQDKYGEKKFGEGLYSGAVNSVINRVVYAVTNNGSLTIDVDLEKLRPKISERIARLEYSLEQQRSAAL